MTASLAAPAAVATGPRRTRRAAVARRPRTWPLAAVVLGVVVVASLLRLAPSPVGPGVTAALDLTTLPTAAARHVEQVLLLPVGALVVVVGRLVLGLRALGVLSPVLLGAALPTTGPVLGLASVVAVMAISTALVRPMTRLWRLPFAARVAVQLAGVSTMLLLPLIALRQVPQVHAEQLTSLPPVALALVTERFAATAERETTRTTVVRSAVTVGEALVIAVIGAGTGLVALLARRPELLLLQVWLVVLVAVRFQARLFEPPPPKPRARKRPTTPKDRPR